MDILAEKEDWEIVFETDSEGNTSKSIKEKFIKTRGLIRKLLDSNHYKMYATERDPAKL